MDHAAFLRYDSELSNERPCTLLIPLTLTSTLELVDGQSPRVITLTVGQGDNTKVFCVNAGILCHRSAFFRGALNGSFQEAQTNSIALPEDDPAVFGDILLWMHRQDYAFHENDTIFNMLDFVVLADKFLIEPGPAQQIADTHMKCFKRASVSSEGIRRAYAIPSAKPIAIMLAKYSVDKYIRAKISKIMEPRGWGAEQFPFEFAEELQEVNGYAADLAEFTTTAICEAEFHEPKRNDHVHGNHRLEYICPISGDLKFATSHGNWSDGEARRLSRGNCNAYAWS